VNEKKSNVSGKKSVFCERISKVFAIFKTITAKSRRQSVILASALLFSLLCDMIISEVTDYDILR